MEVQWTLYTGADVFTFREDIRRVRIAPNVTKVGDRAFRGCSELEEVDLANVTKIGWRTFVGCLSLKHLRLPRTVIEIDHEAFYHCPGLERVDLGNVSKIGRCAFRECRQLLHLSIPPSVIEIDSDAFCNCLALGGVDLSRLGLLSIEEETFAGCSSLKSLILPSTLVMIGEMAFQACRTLRRVELHNGLQKIGRAAFEFCVQLESLSVPPSLMTIGKSAFRSCVSLRTVEFGQGVHHVGEGAFNRCFSLRGIKIPPNAFVIEWGDFPSCSLAEDTFIPIDGEGAEQAEQTIVSGHLGQSKRFLADVEDEINAILGRRDRMVEEKLVLIQSMIAHVKMVEATTCLELALLKASMDKERNLTAAPITRKRRRETRDSSRVICGAEIIIPNVLNFLDGS